MDLLSTLRGSSMEGFLPAGWDLARIDTLADVHGPDLLRPRSWWHPDFRPVGCGALADFDAMLGHEIAREIALAEQQDRPLVLILPVGPMGMYRWSVYFLNEWNISCAHVHGFNMDEWSDAQGNTLASTHPGAFQFAMEKAFYGPLGSKTVPPKQRHFAVQTELPNYAAQIGDLRKEGARVVTVFGIGRVCHIAFWEPTFAAEFTSVDQWKQQTHRLGAKLHPLTIEQERLDELSKSNDCCACVCQHDRPRPVSFCPTESLAGADGILGRGMQWQGLSFRMTLSCTNLPLGYPVHSCQLCPASCSI